MQAPFLDACAASAAVYDDCAMIAFDWDISTVFPIEYDISGAVAELRVSLETSS
jgi:hypothetical protein